MRRTPSLRPAGLDLAQRLRRDARHRRHLHHGLVLAVEPMLMAGGRDTYRTDVDGWTLRTTDGSRAAHIEHTVATTEEGPRILTLP